MNKNNIQLIDIRTPQEISQGKICHTALEIDFLHSDFSKNISRLNREKEYLLYCRSGQRSEKALEIMKGLGFSRISHLEGGILSQEKHNLSHSFI